jgi:cation diffusion facilitator family transporter
MHSDQVPQLMHQHDFSRHNQQAEKKTYLVIVLTAIMMAVEIAAGIAFGSMALLADGWHMGTHVAALGIAAFAFRYARHHADNPAYSFGTGKVSALGGFASAVALASVALLMIVESAQRLISPVSIQFTEALIIACLGFAVNVVSAFMLKQGHNHDHHDHNLKAAYLHVIADALTSVCAIVALACGSIWGWQWLDPIMGVAGGAVIAFWAWGLLKETGSILLDASAPPEVAAKIRSKIEANSDNRITDLHLWQVGPGKWAAIIAMTTHTPRSAEYYKKLLASFDILVHISVEVIWFPGSYCLPPAQNKVLKKQSLMGCPPE